MSGGSREKGGEGWRGRGDIGVEGGAGEEVHVGGGAFSRPPTRSHVWGLGVRS